MAKTASGSANVLCEGVTAGCCETFDLVEDEVTSLKFFRFFGSKSETPYVVSYFLNGLIAHPPI